MKIEIKPIPGLEGLYSVTSDGRVFSHRLRSGEMKFTSDKSGYLRFRFEKNGQKFSKYLHQIVAQAFIPNPENKPEVNHKDLDKSNCSVGNLEWSTRLENNRHARANIPDWKIMRGADNGNALLTRDKVKEIRELCMDGINQKVIAKHFGISQPTVSAIKLKRLWSHV